MKKKYICPEIEAIELMSENSVMTMSIDNTGNGGADEEKQTVIDSDKADIVVGSKGNDMWGNSYNVWE